MKITDQSRYTVLSKLNDIGSLNMLEIGFSATPQLIRNMAARGLVKVTVEITGRGVEHLAKEKIRRARQKMAAQKVLNKLAGGCF